MKYLILIIVIGMVFTSCASNTGISELQYKKYMLDCEVGTYEINDEFASEIARENNFEQFDKDLKAVKVELYKSQMKLWTGNVEDEVYADTCEAKVFFNKELSSMGQTADSFDYRTCRLDEVAGTSETEIEKIYRNCMSLS